MNKLYTIILFITSINVFGQTNKLDCRCAESQIKSDTKPDTIFYLANGTPISFCGYKIRGSTPETYTNFILAFCLPDTVIDIDIWTSKQFYEIRILGDTLLVYDKKITEKFYMKGLEIIHKKFINPSNCTLVNPDTSIYGIILLDEISSFKKIGAMPITHEEKSDLPHLNFCTKDKKQTLTLFFHSGGFVNEFAEFQVKYSSPSDNAKVLLTNFFTTEKEIKLGMSKEKIVSILGTCYSSTIIKSGSELIKYQIDDFSNSGFLKRYNYPSYYAEYEFYSGRLIRFRFGFEYP